MRACKTIARGVGKIPLRRVPIGSVVSVNGWMGERAPRWRFKTLTGIYSNRDTVLAGRRLPRGHVLLVAPSLGGGFMWATFSGEELVDFSGRSTGSSGAGWN